jgi:nicotinic acid phosphoribosyltransferase
MKTSFAVLMALLGFASYSDVQAAGVQTLIENQIDTDSSIFTSNAPAAHAHGAHGHAHGHAHGQSHAQAPKAPLKGDNMADNDKEKDELENIPDVTVDDEVDPNLKTFFLVLKGRKVFMSEEKLGIDRVAKIKEQPHDKNAVFLFDKRT